MDKRFFKVILFLFLSSSSLAAQEQTRATLTLTSSTQVAHAKESIDLEITLRNISGDAFYVRGTIKLALLDYFGNYDLQLRPVGTDSFKTTTKLSSDPLDRPYGTASQGAQFKAQKNIFLLEPRQFFGIRLSGTWNGLTAMPPGKYEMRVVYSGPDRLPLILDKPFLSGSIISNVLQIEVLP